MPRKLLPKAGKLYDQLVLVVESLDDVGKHLDKSQEAWQMTRKRLVDGRGNLVKKFEDIRKLGARTSRQLPDKLVEEADDQEELPQINHQTNKQEQVD